MTPQNKDTSLVGTHFLVPNVVLTYNSTPEITDTSLIITLSSVPMVSVLERFHCSTQFYTRYKRGGVVYWTLNNAVINISMI